jgi:hypothetical protein
MVQKIIGYLLLVIGLFIIIFSLSNIFGLLNKTVVPTNFFDLDAIVVKNNIPLDNFPASIKPLLEQAVNSAPPMVIVNKKDINDTTNFFVYIFVMGFFMNGGYLLAKIGTKLIREVHINVDMPQNKNPQTI